MVSSSSNRTFAIASQLIPSSSNTSAFARRAKRCAADPFRANAISSCRNLLSKNPERIIRAVKSESPRLARAIFGFHGSRGIASNSPGNWSFFCSKALYASKASFAARSGESGRPLAVETGAGAGGASRPELPGPGVFLGGGGVPGVPLCPSRGLVGPSIGAAYVFACVMSFMVISASSLKTAACGQL